MSWLAYCRLQRLPGIAVAILALVVSGVPALGDQSAMIASIQGSANDVKISRDGKLLKAAMGSMLRSKDRVIVTGSTKVRLDMPSGSRIVTASESPFELPSSEALAAKDGLLVRIADLLGWWSDNDTADAAVRSDDTLGAPLLKAKQKVVAGNRRLAIAWNDRADNKPFEVEVKSGENVLAAVTSETLSVATPEIGLQPGTLDVTIKNAKGKRVSYQISVEPGGPEGSSSAHATSEANRLKAFLDAAALAAKDRGAWRLEAYQALVAMGEYEPAALLAKALAGGEKL